MTRRVLPDAVVPATRDWERRTFGPFARRALRGIGEALFTDPHDPAESNAAARFDWLVDDADAMVSSGSRQLRWGIRIAIVLVELLPLFVIGKPRLASSLSLEQRERYLIELEASRITQLALLAVLFKTFLTVLYFEHPEAAPHLGYDARHDRYKVALEADEKKRLAVIA